MTKIYDATKISQEEAYDLYTTACYFGDTKDEVRNKENAGMFVRWTKDGFEFAGILGRYKYLRVSASLNKLISLARTHGKVGEKMLKGYWTLLRGLGL